MRILKSLNLPPDFLFYEIKENEMTVDQLNEMHTLAGTYESLFSKRAKLYKEMGLKDQNLSEKDFKHYLLEHYTFLKRPVFIIGDKIFIGNSQKNIKAVQSELEIL
jgi:arsenate reductase